MAYIAARFRNPEEDAPIKAVAKTDWIGGVCAIISFLLAAATTTLCYLDWDTLTKYIGQ